MRAVPIENPAQRLQSNRFLALYALAAAGGAAAYAPFLTLILPSHVSSIWDDQGVAVLSYIAFAGAIAASIANIAFGWISDRSGSRRGWIIAGLMISSAMLPMMQLAESLTILLIMVIIWQIALNMMLAPLLAWAGDCIPDQQKGMLGGLLSLSPAFGALSGTLVTIPGMADTGTRLLIIACLVPAMVLPVILFGKPIALPHLMEAEETGTDGTNGQQEDIPEKPVQPVRRMWLARLLVQIAEATLFAFLLLWFRSIDGSLTDNFTARMFTLVLFASVPVAIITGRWSDRARRPILPLAITAGLAAIGLAILSVAQSATIGIIGYCVFGVTAGVFLSLHTSQTMRVLPRPATRGRDLGFFNLTNTIPSLIMSWLTLALVPLFGFGALFLLLSALSSISCILLISLLRK